MAEPVRHRQTKEAATDMFDLQPPRHIPTLPISSLWPRADHFRSSAMSGHFQIPSTCLKDSTGGQNPNLLVCSKGAFAVRRRAHTIAVSARLDDRRRSEDDSPLGPKLNKNLVE